MIRLSNGHSFEYVASSGALAFDGRGWWWEQPLRWAKFLDPNLFTIVTKTLTRYPKEGNLRTLRPFRAVRFLDRKGNSDFLSWLNPAGAVNAVNLTNPGIEYWLKEIGPQVEHSGYSVIVSIASDDIEELQKMAMMLDGWYGIKGIELNVSSPSMAGTSAENAKWVVDAVWAVAEVLRSSPLLLKLAVTHDYRTIARETAGLVQALSINSVPWAKVFPRRTSPLKKFGGGGVSGKIIQPIVWRMARELAEVSSCPVIAPSIWDFKDIWITRAQHENIKAVSFGSVFLRYPWRPTLYVRRDKRMRNNSRPIA